MPKQHGQERGSPLTGIPVCPNSTGRKEVAPYRDTCMPKKHGQERGSPLQGYLYAQKAWAGKR